MLVGAISGATAATYTTSVAGTYSLTVTPANGCAATSSSLAVTIINVAVPSSLSTSNIELTKATFNWGSVSNAHHYDIRWRVQGTTNWNSINNISGADISRTKSGLTASTTYEWEIRSACSPGSTSVSGWSATQTFTTATPCPIPTTPVTTGITPTTATLGWNVVSGAWGYKVRYKKTSQPYGSYIYTTCTNTCFIV